MTDSEIIDVESTEIAIREAAPVSLFGDASPVEVVARATEIADALAAVIENKNLYNQIGQRKHVNVEGWTLLGSMLGVFPIVEWTRQTDDGWEARVVVKARNGDEIGAAEAMCSRKERSWKNRDDYAIRSMAQTRAVSKALRHPLGFVMTLAGYDPTPEAEMTAEAQDVTSTQPTHASPASGKPQSWADIKDLMLQYDDGTWEMFERFGAAARKLLFGDEGLSAQQKDELWRVSVGAALALYEIADPAKFPLPSEDDLTKAWASVLEGQELQPVEKQEVPNAP
jgi:hypothetical protein